MMETSKKENKKIFKEIEISAFIALQNSGKDPVSILNELVQLGYISSPKYVCAMTGPSHIPTFTVTGVLECGFGEVSCVGISTTRRFAQKDAAVNLLSKIVPPVKQQEFLSLTEKDLICFCACLKDMYNFEANNWQNPLDDIINMSNSDAAARLAQMFKEGSFNPYGNGMIVDPYKDVPEVVVFIQKAVAGARVALMLKVGSFNPYGNGMILTKVQFMAKHKVRFDKLGLSKKERSQRYQSYTRANGGRVAMKIDNSRVKTENKMKSERNNALIRTELKGQNRFGEVARQTRQPRATLSRFSDCAIHYAQALIDPWSVEAPPCVPDALTLPSWKFGARIRGTFLIGSMGCGYVIANPYQQLGTSTALYYVNSATTFTSPNSFGGINETGTTGATTDSPLTTTGWNLNNNSYRLVGSGLAVRYVGNEMNRGGQIILFRDPQDQLIPGSTASQLLSNKETTTVPVDRSWHYVVWKPSDFQDTSYTLALQNATTGQFCLLVLVVGCTAGQAFEFDFVQWFEVIGRDIPNVTPSENDPIGYAVVKSAIAVPQPPDSPKDNFSRFMNDAMDIANSTLSFIGTGVRGAMKGAAILSNIGLL